MAGGAGRGGGERGGWALPSPGGRRPGQPEAESAAVLLGTSAGSQDGPGGRPQLGSEAGRKLWEGPRSQFSGGLGGGAESFTYPGETEGGRGASSVSHLPPQPGECRQRRAEHLASITVLI